jgi:ABC-type glycerol-3-phosphate transport system substrate-binding protein
MGEREQLASWLLQQRLSRRALLKAGAAAPLGAAMLSATGGRVGAQSPQPAPDFSGTTLRVWSGATVAPPTEAAAAGWSELTGGQVQVEAIPFGERALKFAGLVTAQDPAIDLCYISGDFAARFGDRLYVDLSDPALGVDSSIYVPAILPIFTSDGALRGLPVHSEMEIFIYNKTMFEAAGLDPENPPDTWQGLYDAAEALINGDRFGCAVPWSNTTFNAGAAYYLCFLNSIPGARLLSDDRSEALFGDENGLKAFQTIDAGFKANFFAPGLGADVEDYATGKMFNAGQTASMINFAELWGYATGATPPDETWELTLEPEEVGASILPGIESGNSGSINGFEGFGLNRYGIQQEAALHFLTYLTTPPFQKEMNLGKTLPSSNTAVLNDPEVIAVYPVGSVLAEQGGFNLDRYGAPYDWTPPFGDWIARMYRGEATPEEAHAATLEAVNGIISLWQIT